MLKNSKRKGMPFHSLSPHLLTHIRLSILKFSAAPSKVLVFCAGEVSIVEGITIMRFILQG